MIIRNLAFLTEIQSCDAFGMRKQPHSLDGRQCCSWTKGCDRGSSPDVRMLGHQGYVATWYRCRLSGVLLGYRAWTEGLDGGSSLEIRRQGV